MLRRDGLGGARNGGQQRDVEAALQHRRSHGGLPDGLVERGEPLEHSLGQRLGHEGRPVGRTALGRGAGELLQVQGYAARPGVQQLDQPARRPPTGQQVADQQLGLLAVQRRQPELLGRPLHEQPGPPGSRRCLLVQLVGAQRAGDQQRQLPDPAGEVRDDLEAELVAPVQVLDGQ